VYTVGNPISLKLNAYVARGIVSGNMLSEGNTLLQTDTPIHGDDSGGTLSNTHGQMVGTVSSKFFGTGVQGMGFAIPFTVLNAFRW